MQTKQEIVENWLPRYTGLSLDQFGDYIILVNFSHYVELFSQWHQFCPLNSSIKNKKSIPLSLTLGPL